MKNIKRIFIPIPTHGRIDAFDFLKSVMIFFVIVLHVSMTYMKNVPSWWYVVNEVNSSVFTIIVNILDVFIIPVLFFISGYFTPASYIKKGVYRFLLDKTKHIALIWILGVIFLIPLFSLFSGKNISYIIVLLKEEPLYLFYNQAHLWYLGVLYVFYVFYALYAHLIAPVGKVAHITSKSPALLLSVLIVISGIIAFLSNSYFTNFDNWINIGYIFSVKPAKIMTYVSIFVLGIYAWRQNWFTKDGWMPDLKMWRVLAIGSMACYMILRLLLIPDFGYPLLSKIEPLFDSLCSFAVLFYVVILGIKLQTLSVSGFFIKMAPYSYGIYWVHMPLMILYLYSINTSDFPFFIKWASGIAVTVIVSWFISKYVLKRAFLLKEIF